ncbi:hypothetical protein QZH41_020463, partial [Actinostola sp. cb2023]
MAGSEFLYGNFLDRINGYVLVKKGTLLERVEVKNVLQCVMRCLRNHSCLSLNYGVQQIGVKQCEVLNWGATGYDKFLVAKDNFFHMRQQTICASNPCGPIYECVPQLGNNLNFSCVCSSYIDGINNCTNKADTFCHDLGMERRMIRNLAISGSSKYDIDHLPRDARLNYQTSWVPNPVLNSWIEVTLQNITILLGVATQGRHDTTLPKTCSLLINYRTSIEPKCGPFTPNREPK